MDQRLMVIILATIILILLCYILRQRIKRPNGILNIDEYTDKDSYLMMWLTPLPDLKKHKRLTLEVRVIRHAEESSALKELNDF